MIVKVQTWIYVEVKDADQAEDACGALTSLDSALSFATRFPAGELVSTEVDHYEVVSDEEARERGPGRGVQMITAIRRMLARREPVPEEFRVLIVGDLACARRTVGRLVEAGYATRVPSTIMLYELTSEGSRYGEEDR